MRTTVDIPDETYGLKAEGCKLEGTTMREFALRVRRSEQVGAEPARRLQSAPEIRTQAWFDCRSGDEKVYGSLTIFP